MAIQTGDRIPDFSLPDQDNNMVRMADYIGKNNLVIYFYPKDNTSGCTAEACAFRDSFHEFKNIDAEVFGISSDSVKSHKSFAQQYNLAFGLLSDSEKSVRKLFGVPGNLFGLVPGRVTYIVDKQGIVRGVYNSQMDPTGHVQKSLEKLKEISAETVG